MYRAGNLAATDAGDGMQQTGDADDAGCYGSVFVDSSVETKLSPPPRRDAEPRFVAVVTECRANPVVSRRGYLLITVDKGQDESAAVKRWAVRYSIAQFNNLTLYVKQFFLDYTTHRKFGLLSY